MAAGRRCVVASILIQSDDPIRSKSALPTAPSAGRAIAAAARSPAAPAVADTGCNRLLRFRWQSYGSVKIAVVVKGA